jgi:DNA transposition AAA+ family ATPase
MNTEAKLTIKNDLYQFVQKVGKGSQNAASKQLTKVSNATISNILAGKWDNIAESMWLSIQKQVSSTGNEWKIIPDTKRMIAVNKVYSDAQNNSEVFCIVAPEGSGKSVPAEYYASNNDNVFLVKAGEHLNRKTFLTETLRSLGKDSGGYTVYEMMGLVVETLLRIENPLIIIDEADKLTDQVLYFFITIYNETEDRCGLVLQATDHLEKRIDKGVKINKKGFKEIYSRIGRRFISLPPNTQADLEKIAVMNGVDDELEVVSIVNDCEGDIRRIKRLVRKFNRKKTA